MPRKATSLTLNEGDYDYLHSLIKQRTIQAQVVIRAHILLDRYNGTPIRTIAQYMTLVRQQFNSVFQNTLTAERKAPYLTINAKVVR